MKSALRRIAVAGVIAPALALGAPALALADAHYASEGNAAGPHGAVSASVESHAGDRHGKDDGEDCEKRKKCHGHDDGGASYEASIDKAGPHGAFSAEISSSAH